jgi:hypothetical protein
MTLLSEFRSTSGTLTRCVYFSHILLTLVSEVFSLLCTVRSFSVMDVVFLPIANPMECNGASPCETQIILGKASCFVFYMHWRNYTLCGCNISRSSQVVNKLFLFLQAIFILRPHYVQWMVKTCLLFVNTPTDMGLVSQWSIWNFIKENMLCVYEIKCYREDAIEVACVIWILAGLLAILRSLWFFRVPWGTFWNSALITILAL